MVFFHHHLSTFPVRGFPPRSPLISLISLFSFSFFVCWKYPSTHLVSLLSDLCTGIICLFSRQRCCSCSSCSLMIFCLCFTPVLLSQFCLAGLRHCLMDLGASTGVSAFLMVCGIIPHTLYTQSFAFFCTWFNISRPEHCITTFFTFRSGGGAWKKKDFLVHIDLFSFSYEARFHELDFWTTTKNGRVLAGGGATWITCNNNDTLSCH